MLNETEAHTSSNQWYLVHCQTKKEPFAAAFLQEVHGLQTYLPAYTLRAQGKERAMLLFPNYLFVHMDLNTGVLSKINASPGVRYLVEFGGEPAVAPDYVIEEIKMRLAGADGGYRQLLKSGDHVRMKYAGPLQDLEMIFVRADGPEGRVRVLLNILGRLKEIYLSGDMLEKKSDQQMHKRERFTRGKGRKIKSIH